MTKHMQHDLSSSTVTHLASYLPQELQSLTNPQTDLPRIAKDTHCIRRIEDALHRVPTTHTLYLHDARELTFLPSESIHLILTSPPYWTLKQYPLSGGQLGNLSDYRHFLAELAKVWTHCFRVLVPGGRLICVVGDVCLSRRKNRGRHTVVPLHAAIQEQCRQIGFDNLAPIIWYKIANAIHEVENGSSFLGKPYEPNAVVKNDIEFILMQRKPGGYRQPSVSTRVMSVISSEHHQQWFQQIWQGLTGASTKKHPAPFPLELAERLIRMFSFAGDIVLDPFMGTGTTNLAAALWGRHSIGCEIDKHYLGLAYHRMMEETRSLFRQVQVTLGENEDLEPGVHC
jgi:DNA modification methylase